MEKTCCGLTSRLESIRGIASAMLFVLLCCLLSGCDKPEASQAQEKQEATPFSYLNSETREDDSVRATIYYTGGSRFTIIEDKITGARLVFTSGSPIYQLPATPLEKKK